MNRWWWIAGVLFIALWAGAFFTSGNSEKRNAELLDQAKREAAKSMQRTQDCLSGIESEGYTTEEGCEAGWSMENRVIFYLKILEEMPPSLY